jgi:hypothetical protein
MFSYTFVCNYVYYTRLCIYPSMFTDYFLTLSLFYNLYYVK